MAEPGYDESGNPLVKGVVAATGVAVHASVSGNEKLAERMQAEMTQAVAQAHSEGITDPEEIKARVFAVRDRIRDEG